MIGWRVTAIGYGLIGFLVGMIIYQRLSSEKSLQIEPKPTNKVNIIQLFNNKLFIFSVLVLICDVFASLSLYIFLPFLFLKSLLL